MIKYCIDKWNKNKDKLEEKLRDGTTWNSCDYSDLVKLVVEQILNGGLSDNDYSFDTRWDSSRITIIDNGDYQGTLLFLIPRDTYQPAEYDYLMTYVGYGSCSACDTLKAIQTYNYESDGRLTDEQVKDFMTLCRYIVTGMILPYNTGWRYSEEFEPCNNETELS